MPSCKPGKVSLAKSLSLTPEGQMLSKLGRVGVCERTFMLFGRLGIMQAEVKFSSQGSRKQNHSSVKLRLQNALDPIEHLKKYPRDSELSGRALGNLLYLETGAAQRSPDIGRKPAEATATLNSQGCISARRCGRLLLFGNSRAGFSARSSPCTQRPSNSTQDSQRARPHHPLGSWGSDVAGEERGPGQPAPFYLLRAEMRS